MAEIDERFKRGKIYTIRNRNDNTLIYVGSTINTLYKRFTGHKVACKRGDSTTLYNYITDNDWTDWYCELYEDYQCNNKNELNRREGEVIRLIGSINKFIAGRTRKEYNIENVDKLKEKAKQYYIENAEKINERNKKYNIENVNKLKEYGKKYNIENVDKLKEYGKKHRIENADKIKEKHKEYYINNVEKLKKKVICEHCKLSIRNSDLSRHHKSAKCIKAQQKIN